MFEAMIENMLKGVGVTPEKLKETFETMVNTVRALDQNIRVIYGEIKQSQKDLQNFRQELIDAGLIKPAVIENTVKLLEVKPHE